MSGPGPASRGAKSNRDQGEMFELLVARNLTLDTACEAFAYAADLQAARERVRRRHRADAAKRLALQEAAAEASRAPILRLVQRRAETLGAVVRVVWISRQGGTGKTVADLAVLHRSGETRLSLKSTRRGSGTARNAGTERISEWAGEDMGFVRDWMTEEVLDVVGARGGIQRRRELAGAGTKLRSVVSEAERAWAREVGGEILGLVGDTVTAALARRDQDYLRGLVNWAHGDPDPALFEVRASEDGVKIRPCGVAVTGVVAVERRSPTRVRLTVDGRPAVHLQICCTNGVGLSPICARVFLDTPDGA